MTLQVPIRVSLLSDHRLLREALGRALNKSVDPTALPGGERICLAVADKTLARTGLCLNQRSRMTLGYEAPVRRLGASVASTH
jgi:hypothetical protein